MAFWGVEVKPGKPWTHTLDDSRGKLRMTQATLGNGSGPKKCTVQCNVGSRQPVLSCSLLPDKVESCSLDLEFEEAEEVVFSVLGPWSVHLTGYFLGCCGAGDGDDTDSYGEDIAESSGEEGDSDESEESYEDDFIDDGDVDMLSTSPKRNSGVVIKEIEEDEAPATASGECTSANIKPKLLISPESEDEDGFPITSQRRSKNNKSLKCDDLSVTPDNLTQEKKVDFLMNEEKPAECNLGGDDTKNCVKSKKERKVKTKKGKTSIPPANFSADKNGDTEKDNGEDDKKEVRDAVNQDSTGGDGGECKSDNNDTSILSSPGTTSKKNKKNKKRTKEDTSNDANEIHTKTMDDAQSNADKSDPGSIGSKKKRKKAKGSDSVTENGSTEMKTEDIQPLQTRTFPKGFVVEELKMGLPNGKRASVGKKVSVNYIGKLKDGKIFDSTVGKRPFQFRLGVGQVIKGWDIGVDGMRVGDKRRLTIPPPLAYGDKKVGPIPANSGLIFDVELVDVK